MKSNVERTLECLNCEYWEKCNQTVAVPDDYPDGSCKVKNNFRDKRSVTNGKEKLNKEFED